MTKSKKDPLGEGLYKGLQALSDLSFPKKCSTCGKRYETAEDFISQTRGLPKSSGLKADIGDDDKTVIVELFRNCTCGSTLMDEFTNRRNLSSTGMRRREKFSELMERLIGAGFEEATARQELLKILRGGTSHIIRVKKG